MQISSTTTLHQIATDSITSNTGPIHIPKIQIPANLGNLGMKLRQQTTVLDVMNKVIEDGHALKENNHATEDRIKGSTYTCFIEALTGSYEGKQETREYDECKNLHFHERQPKKTLFFLEKYNKSKLNSV